MKIKLNAKHKGELHQDLHMPQDQPISMADLMKAKQSTSAATRKRATFAANARQWGK